MISFNFNGKDSFKDYGIIISKRPSLPSPKRRVTYIDIPGRDSSLTYDEETYENITITVECKLKSNNLLEKVDEIKAWLISAGENDLIFSFQDDKKYIGQVVNSIDFNQVVKVFSEFIIVFNCNPFKYSVLNQTFTILESDSSIINIGSLKSEPVISIFGDGDIELMINESKINLTNIDERIILNTVIQDAYNDLGENLNHKTSGEFIYLQPGSNKLEWLGNINKIEITPNWRWI